MSSAGQVKAGHSSTTKRHNLSQSEEPHAKKMMLERWWVRGRCRAPIKALIHRKSKPHLSLWFIRFQISETHSSQMPCELCPSHVPCFLQVFDLMLWWWFLNRSPWLQDRTGGAAELRGGWLQWRWQQRLFWPYFNWFHSNRERADQQVVKWLQMFRSSDFN